MIIQILGLKKTKKDFISKISQISSDVSILKSNLSQLNIFSDIADIRNKVTVIELKNKISINSKGKDKNSITINFPNLFGKAENINLNINSIKEYEVSFTKPFIFSKFLVFANVNNSRHVKKLFDEEHIIDTKEIGVSSKYFELGYGLDKYIFMKYNMPYLNINLKKGIDFTKITSMVNIDFDVLRLFRYNFKIGSGMALGNIPPVDRFYLGENIKGYKNNSISPVINKNKVGGRSYLEITNKMIFGIRNINFYLFGSMGLNNKEENLGKIFNELPNIKTSALGLSIGTGISIPMHGKEGPNIDMSLAFPLVRSSNTEMYQFSFDIGF
ncbi:hypothetical protein P3W45_000615 [Vairimorpha bombi]|jgi:outer membrane protein insertion porin family